MANKTMKYNLEVNNLDETVKEFEKFNDEIDDSKEALSKPIGDKAFDNLNNDLKEGVDNTEKFEQAAQKLDGGIKVLTGGVGVAAGVMGAFGSESEKVQETLLKVQSAIAFTTGIKDLTEGFTQLGIAQKAYNFVVGTSTGLMKAFKVALAATGIGLLVTGLALLITNFDKVIEVVEDVVSQFGFLQTAFDKVKGFFVALGLAQSEQAEATEEYIQKQTDLTAEIEKRYDTEIRLARAAGEDTKQLELEKQQEIQKTLGKQLSALNSLRDENGELVDEQEEQYTELSAALEESVLRQKELTIQLKRDEKIAEEKAADERIRIEKEANEETRRKREENARAKTEAEEQAERESEVKQIRLNREREAAAELKVLNAETDEAILQAKVEQIQTLKDIELQDTELTESQRKLIIRQAELDIKNLREQFNKESNDKIVEDTEQTTQEVQTKWQMLWENIKEGGSEKFKEVVGEISSGLDMASQAVGALGDAFTAISENRLQKIKNEESEQIAALNRQREAGLITEKQLTEGISDIEENARNKEQKQKKKAFKQNKAIQITNAVIDTARGVATGLGAPFPLNIIMPILAGITGAAQIALISKQKFPEGGSGGGGGGAAAASAASSAPSTASAGISQAGGGGGGELVSFTPNSEPEVTGNFIDEDNRQNSNNEKRQPITVAENDISNTQNRVRVIEDDAAFE